MDCHSTDHTHPWSWARQSAHPGSQDQPGDMTGLTLAISHWALTHGGPVCTKPLPGKETDPMTASGPLPFRVDPAHPAPTPPWLFHLGNEPCPSNQGQHERGWSLRTQSHLSPARVPYPLWQCPGTASQDRGKHGREERKGPSKPSLPLHRSRLRAKP